MEGEGIRVIVAVGADGPDIAGTRDGNADENAIFQVRSGHYAPIGAVPMEDECLVGGLPDCPDVVGASGGNTIQVVRSARDAGAGHGAPGGAVPVHDHGLGWRVVCITDGPNIVRRNYIDRSQGAGIGEGEEGPGGAVPMVKHHTEIDAAVLAFVAHCPYVIRGGG